MIYAVHRSSACVYRILINVMHSCVLPIKPSFEATIGAGFLFYVNCSVYLMLLSIKFFLFVQGPELEHEFQRNPDLSHEDDFSSSAQFFW